MILGGKTKDKRRKGAPVPDQTPFTAEALVKVQEEARIRAVAEYRAPAQAKFAAAWGLAR